MIHRLIQMIGRVTRLHKDKLNGKVIKITINENDPLTCIDNVYNYIDEITNGNKCYIKLNENNIDCVSTKSNSSLRFDPPLSSVLS